jgi:hypothetical protein
MASSLFSFLNSGVTFAEVQILGSMPWLRDF